MFRQTINPDHELKPLKAFKNKLSLQNNQRLKIMNSRARKNMISTSFQPEVAVSKSPSRSIREISYLQSLKRRHNRLRPGILSSVYLKSFDIVDPQLQSMELSLMDRSILNDANPHQQSLRQIERYIQSKNPRFGRSTHRLVGLSTHDAAFSDVKADRVEQQINTVSYYSVKPT